jgi:hypothetical protein
MIDQHMTMLLAVAGELADDVARGVGHHFYGCCGS